MANWAADVQAETHAAAVKPERACGDHMVELGRIGGWMGDDLTGMTSQAPLQVAQDHEALVHAIANLTAVAAHACGDPAQAAGQVDPAVRRVDLALAKVMRALDGLGRGRGTTTGLPEPTN